MSYYNEIFNKWFDAEYPRDSWNDTEGCREDFRKALRHAYLQGTEDGKEAMYNGNDT